MSSIRRKLRSLEGQIVSLSRDVRTKLIRGRGHVQQKWEDHQRAKADQVRDINVHGEFRNLVESNGELRDDSCRAGRGKLSKKEVQSPKAINAVHIRPPKKYLKVQEVTLDDRGKLGVRNEVQCQDEAKEELAPSRSPPCRDHVQLNFGQPDQGNSDSPACLWMPKNPLPRGCDHLRACPFWPDKTGDGWVEIDRELRNDSCRVTGGGKRSKEEDQSPEAVNAVHIRPPKKYLKVQEVTLDDRGKLGVRNEVQCQDEAKDELAPSRSPPCQDHEQLNLSQPDQVISKNPLPSGCVHLAASPFWQYKEKSQASKPALSASAMVDFFPFKLQFKNVENVNNVNNEINELVCGNEDLQAGKFNEMSPKFTRKSPKMGEETSKEEETLSSQLAHKSRACGGEGLRRKKKNLFGLHVRRKKAKWHEFFKERKIKVVSNSPGSHSK